MNAIVVEECPYRGGKGAEVAGSGLQFGVKE